MKPCLNSTAPARVQATPRNRRASEAVMADTMANAIREAFEQAMSAQNDRSEGESNPPLSHRSFGSVTKTVSARERERCKLKADDVMSLGRASSSRVSLGSQGGRPSQPEPEAEGSPQHSTSPSPAAQTRGPTRMVSRVQAPSTQDTSLWASSVEAMDGALTPQSFILSAFPPPTMFQPGKIQLSQADPRGENENPKLMATSVLLAPAAKPLAEMHPTTPREPRSSQVDPHGDGGHPKVPPTSVSLTPAAQPLAPTQPRMPRDPRLSEVDPRGDVGHPKAPPTSVSPALSAQQLTPMPPRMPRDPRLSEVDPRGDGGHPKMLPTSTSSAPAAQPLTPPMPSRTPRGSRSSAVDPRGDGGHLKMLPTFASSAPAAQPLTPPMPSRTPRGPRSSEVDPRGDGGHPKMLPTSASSAPAAQPLTPPMPPRTPRVPRSSEVDPRGDGGRPKMLPTSGSMAPAAQSVTPPMPLRTPRVPRSSKVDPRVVGSHPKMLPTSASPAPTAQVLTPMPPRTPREPRASEVGTRGDGGHQRMLSTSASLAPTAQPLTPMPPRTPREPRLSQVAASALAVSNLHNSSDSFVLPWQTVTPPRKATSAEAVPWSLHEDFTATPLRWTPPSFEASPSLAARKRELADMEAQKLKDDGDGVSSSARTDEPLESVNAIADDIDGASSSALDVEATDTVNQIADAALVKSQHLIDNIARLLQDGRGRSSQSGGDHFRVVRSSASARILEKASVPFAGVAHSGNRGKFSRALSAGNLADQTALNRATVQTVSPRQTGATVPQVQGRSARLTSRRNSEV
eukprot:TRINITY_DN4939_c0_g1_i1.p1 TRINITY_DN4939_c0_g1~~TRINITY_DN4939_c0_g1_i1.p1  ORF type:complete len:798 (-),score=129.00 TRINITY_DN4939_c0_g1_i1:167-2560(-)